MAKQHQSELKRPSGTSSWFEALPVWKQNGICVLLMLVLLGFLFNDIIFKGMIFSDSGDTATHEAWPAAMAHIRNTEQVEPLWIPYIFGGMPIAGALIFPREVNYVQDFVVGSLSKVLFAGAQLHWMIMPFLMMGCAMFFLARELKFSSPVSLFAALVMMLNPYAVGLPETGHGSKLIVLGYIPLLFLCVYKLFQERSVLMFALTAAAAGTMLLADHPQMAFYGLLFMGLYLLNELVYDLRQAPREGILKAALFAGAILIGFALYAYHALPTLEYAKYSIRGGGGGGDGAAAGATGLAYDYATNWSFHPAEMMNFLVPSFFGYESPIYWGWMPFTNSTVYVGLLPLVFAGIALAFRRNRMTWFLMGFAVLILFISFGRHFGVIYNLMFNYFPFFNKLRIPVMILHVLPVAVGLLAAYGLDWMITRFPQMKLPEVQAAQKKLLRALIAIGVALVVFVALKDVVQGFLSGFCFTNDAELPQLRQQYGAQAMQALAQYKQLRFEALWKDAVKCLVLGGLSVGLIMAFLQKKVGPLMFVVAVTVITIGDLWYYDVKYINPKPAAALEAQFAGDEVLDRLAEENAKEPFRVLDPTGKLDQQNELMHRLIPSVEGYSPAKLKIYQDLRDSCFRNGGPAVFNMLNVKYIVTRTQSPSGIHTVKQPNPDALPRAWFVDSVIVAPSPQGVFRTLNDRTWNPRTTAVLERALPSAVSTAPDDHVRLTKYSSRSIELAVAPAAPKLLVLSEIYYPAGWKAYVDGQETEIFKTNYVLRSVIVPAGSHTVEFRFHPDSYETGLTLTQSAWGGTVLLLLAGVFLHPGVRKRLKKA
jgi:hypothetical protein